MPTVNTIENTQNKFKEDYVNKLKDLLDDPTLNTVPIELITAADTKKSVVLIQACFRRFLIKKKLHKLVCEKLENARRYINSAIEFKDSWEIYFIKNEEYEFSLKGINHLKKRVLEFYDSFFNLEDIIIGNDIITLDDMKNFNYSSITKKTFRKCLIIYMKQSFYLGTQLESQPFPSEVGFEEFDLSNLNNNNKVDINVGSKPNFANLLGFKRKSIVSPQIEKNINSSKNAIFEKDGKKLNFGQLLLQAVSDKEIINDNDYQRETTEFLSPKKIIRRKNIATWLKPDIKPLEEEEGKKNVIRGKASEPIPSNRAFLFTYEVQYKESEIYIKKALHDILKFEEENCVNKGFEDEDTRITYSGSFNENTNTKEGLGYEYMIDHTKGTIYKYCGFFQSNKFHGIGLLSKETGENYTGEFREGNKCGYGIYTSKDIKYHGFFKDDKFEGYGVVDMIDKYTYCGTWKEGKKSGFGFYMNFDRCTYCGQFKENMFDGIGYFKWPDGHNYIGGWENNLMSGYGQYSYKNGDKYVGSYKNDLKEGFGAYLFHNGSKLKGKWSKGKKSGEFIFMDPSKGDKDKISYLYFEDDVQLIKE